MNDTSIASFLNGLFGGGLSSIETDLATAEKVTLNGLTFASTLIAAGATASEDVVTELQALLPKVDTAIANAATKAEGWAAALKTELAGAEAWIAARVVTVADSAAPDAPVGAARFHIA